MNKEELKKMRLENLRKGREARAAKKATEPTVDTPSTNNDAPAKGESAGAPAPLPPLAPPPPLAEPSISPGKLPPPAGEGAGLNDEKLKQGLASTFQSGTQGLANVLNLVIKKTSYEIHFSAPSEGESALWAEFALPVLKQYMPDLQNSPVKTLVVFTIIILSGKVTIIKKPVQEETNAPTV